MEQPQDHTNSDAEFAFSSTESEASDEAAKEEAILATLRRTYADYKKAYPQGDLCQRCACINWANLLSNQDLHDRDVWNELFLFCVPETSQEPSASSCPLCRLMSPDRMFGKDPDRTLFVYNACRLVRYPRGPDKHGWEQYAPCLELRDSYAPQEGSRCADRKYILQDACTGTQCYLLRKLDSAFIDYEILRQWLRYCKRQHTGCNHIYDSFISGLKVIDCTTGNVINAPQNTAFHCVALSYVWGGTKSSGKDQDKFPATICDAITVTVQLGYRYLWVDQYCINQLAAGHKQAQIQLMGRIYAEAELVIIAAAGSSSDYGLPGVSTKARVAQRRTLLDDDVEMIAMNEPDRELRMSTWAQRGWTHQEGYLATRRLVFTDNEVLYVCNQGVWQESVQRPAMENDGHYLFMTNECFPRTALSLANNYTVIFGFLLNYSQKTLSYDSDILNACIGVLNKLVGHRHFWGMVVPQLNSGRYIPLCLEWRSQIPGQRREGFPSWPWAATTGPKMFHWCGQKDHREGYVAHIRTIDGRWLPPEEQTESQCDPLPMNLGPTLRLDATLYTAFLSMDTKYRKPEKYEKERNKTPKVIFQSTDGNSGEIEIVFNLELDAKVTESDLKNGIRAILVSGKELHILDPTFMILQAVGDHYKRIGITSTAICRILEKRTGTMRERSITEMLSYEACRGSEETIHIE
ncbi:hypothetical protein AA0112_g4137 [Alternaria arborescens]|nr:hypothetical protein AA0112_g4137 [Alternaria arborescens]